MIVAEKDGGKVFGVVKTGQVKVIINGETVGRLEKGEIFGEIAFVLDSKRTATLKAASTDTEVVIFSLSAIRRLENGKDRIMVWQNFAKVLAGRLIERTNGWASKSAYFEQLSY